MVASSSTSAVWLLVWLGAWALAIWYSNKLGNNRNRRHCWLWGLFLGWIGVIIVALTHSREDPEIARLEKLVRMKELTDKLNS